MPRFTRNLRKVLACAINLVYLDDTAQVTHATTAILGLLCGKGE